MIKINKRKLFLSSLLSLMITVLQIAGWQLSMDYGSSIHQFDFFQNIGVLTTGQCIVWGLFEWIALDVLFYLLFTFLENKDMCPDGRPEKRHLKAKYLWVYVFFLLFAIWLFFLWCCYPGYYNYDTGNQVVQVLYDYVFYDAHHPLLHTLFSGGLIKLGYRIDNSSLALGVFLANAVQIFIVSLCMTYALRYVYIRSRNIALTIFSFCFYAFCPTLVMFAMTPTKDVLCYAFLLVGVIHMTKLYDALARESNPTLWDWILTGLFLMLSCLMRKNIIYAVVVFAALMLLLFRKAVLKQLLLYACVFLLCSIINKGLLLALNAIPGEADEALCVPYQQIARLYVEEGADAFTEEELDLLSQVVPPESLLCYDPVMADGIKAQFSPGLDTLLENKGAYFRLWLDKGLDYPDVYLESLLFNTYQAWYPWTTNVDATKFRYFDFTGWNDEYGNPHWPALFDFYEDFGTGGYTKIPLLRLLFTTGTMFWLCIIAWFYSIWRKDRPAMLSYLMVLLVCGTNLLGPVADVRYYLILFYLLPVCLSTLLPKRKVAVKTATAEPELQMTA